MQIYQLAKAKKSTWLGGETFEYFVYPADSNVQAQDFELRISSATIDLTESNFTKFENHKRFLMILEGEMDIIFHGKRSQKLKKHEFVEFLGSWNTNSISKSKVKDFNVIYDPSYEMYFSKIKLKKNTRISKEHDFTFLLNLSEKLETTSFDFDTFDLLKIENSVIFEQDLTLLKIELRKLKENIPH
jgi:environmental stress-induced protein Ves